jgi:hypothetical protein
LHTQLCSANLQRATPSWGHARERPISRPLDPDRRPLAYRVQLRDRHQGQHGGGAAIGTAAAIIVSVIILRRASTWTSPAMALGRVPRLPTTRCGPIAAGTHVGWLGDIVDARWFETGNRELTVMTNLEIQAADGACG